MTVLRVFLALTLGGSLGVLSAAALNAHRAGMARIRAAR